MARDDLQLLQGTLDVLVLKTLSWGPRHGYEIARWIKDTTGAELQVEDRALYVALHRMEERGWLDAEWGVTGNNRQAKYYRLTREGRRQLAAKSETWSRYAAAISKVLRTVLQSPLAVLRPSTTLGAVPSDVDGRAAKSAMRSDLPSRH